MPQRNHSDSPIVLKAEGLVKIYGKRRVVDGVSFHVNRGEIVGLLGPNGAGKTTSFRMTCGLINSNGGIVHLGPHDVTGWPMYRRSREGGMGYLPQDRSVFQKLSVQNNLYGVMEMLGIRRAERKRRCNELLEKFSLTHLRKNPGGSLSGGERRRLEIARSLVSDPKIILLDEPFAAVDPITVAGIQDIIRQLADEGISILITDHSVQDTLQITQRSYVIQAGQVLCHGTPAEVLGNPEARKAYFGENVNVEQIQSSSIISASSISLPPQRPVEQEIGETNARIHKKTPHHLPEQPKVKIKNELPGDSGGVPPASPAPYSASSPPASPDLYPDSDEMETSVRYVPRPSRSVGRRLVPTAPQSMPERPIVRSTNPVPEEKKVDPPPQPVPETSNEPEPAASGVIRTLGTLIWGK